MAVAYEPASIAIYKICESRYAYPIKARCGKIAIRNDSYGEGDYGAKRSGGRKHTGIDIFPPAPMEGFIGPLSHL